jgi:oxygen-dependent protoporphyrinogen oxidase
VSRRVAVVGAGMAGLAAAYEAAKAPGWELTLYEAADRLGGTVETVHHSSALGEYVIECGPDSWVSDKPWARELAIELGLEDELIYSNDATRRTYLARGRELIPMPDGMRMMVPTRWEPILSSPLFSEKAREAYRDEPFRADELKANALANNPDADESVASFVRRHFGDEATETIAGPLLAGVFGGDVNKLSARATLAPFVKMEREYGSLITALAAREPRSVQPIFTTLRSGLSTLVDRMAATLPPNSVRLKTRVLGIARQGAMWQIDTGKTDHFDAVVLATPAHVTRELLAPLDPEAAELLDMEATSAVVVALLFEPAVPVPQGFGFLVPPEQALSGEPSLLAGTFMDQKFASRAPLGSTFLRGYFGGLAAPRMLAWSDEQIVEAARAQLARMLGPLPTPSFSVVRRWPQSLPQYSVGHIARMHELEARIRALSGLRLVGNAYRGVGLPNLVDEGRKEARALLSSDTANARKN